MFSKIHWEENKMRSKSDLVCVCGWLERVIGTLKIRICVTLSICPFSLSLSLSSDGHWLVPLPFPCHVPSFVLYIYNFLSWFQSRLTITISFSIFRFWDLSFPVNESIFVLSFLTLFLVCSLACMIIGTHTSRVLLKSRLTLLCHKAQRVPSFRFARRTDTQTD